MRTFLFGLSLCLLVTACKKVDNYYKVVDGQPWIDIYPTTYYVGDTMTISGKLFIGQGGVLQVGSIQPSFVSVTRTALVPNTGPGDSLDVVSFLITKEMGVGNNVPVSLSTKTVVVQSPAITIKLLSGVQARTDTTLWVDQITTWQPANLSDYQNQNLPLIVGSSVSFNGSIYFNNPLGIFSVIGGSVQAVVSAGSQLSDKNGTFRVNQVLGSAISFDGNTLAFSVIISDNADTLSNTVFRFCTMDIGSRMITTLNRTLEPMSTPNQAGSSGPFTGPVAQANLVVTAISADVNGNWYFSNIYQVPYPGYSTNGPWTDNPTHGYENEMDNICELGGNGNIKSLFRLNYPGAPKLFIAPGFPIIECNSSLISQDGSTAYIHNSFLSGAGYDNEAEYNLNDQALLSAPAADANFKFISYDTSVATGAASMLVQFGFNAYIYSGLPDQMLPLSNGYILINNGLSSLYAFNVLNQTMFCYAGTEQGVVASAPAVQDQATGQAKFVNFALNGNSTYFNGLDAKGVVYYFTAPDPYGSPVTGGPLTFYKLYSKQ